MYFIGSRDWQTAGKDRQLLCWDCRAHLKKTNELPPVSHNKDSKDKDSKDSTGGKEESPDASPQRMRTRNKAAKEQTTNRSSRPKRGGTETPEPKTPSKINANSPAEKSTTPNTPAKKKGKTEKQETPNKTRKRAQEKVEEPDLDEKDLGLFKKKRERAEVIITRYYYITNYVFIVPLLVESL